MGRGQLTLLSIITMAIANQALVPPMYKEMKDRSPRRFAWILFAAVVSTWLIFAGVSICSILIYGLGTASNVLVALPQDTFASIARASMVVVTIALTPLMVYPLMAPILSRLPVDAGTDDDSYEPLCEAGEKSGVKHWSVGPYCNKCIRFFTPAAILAVAILLGVSAGELGVVNDYNGAMCVAVFLVYAPWAIGRWIMTSSKRLSVLLHLHILAGVAISVLCFAWGGGNFTGDMQTGCFW